MDRYFIRYLIMFMTYCAAFRMGAQIERYVIKHGPIISMPVMDEPPYDEDTFITVWPVDPVTSEGSPPVTETPPPATEASLQRRDETPPPVTEPTILRNQLMCPPVRDKKGNILLCYPPV